MGEYAEYSINGVDLYLLKNDSASAPYLMEVFVPNDLVRDEIKDGEDERIEFKFSTTVGIASRRLDIRGYTLDRAQKEYDDAVSKMKYAYAASVEESDSDKRWISVNGSSFSVTGDYLDSISERSNFEKAYQQYFENRHSTDVNRYSLVYPKEQPLTPVNLIAEKLFDADRDMEEPLIPIDDIWVLRIILSVLSEKCEVIYDCSDVINDWDDAVESRLLDFLNTTVFSPSRKVFVLTEGRTDDEFITDAFELLEPDIAFLFKFFDHHDEYRPEKNADATLRLAKAIASAGLSERFVAIFDNDTIGQEKMLELQALKATNIITTCLPDLEIAKNYPCIGPDGKNNSDANERACAIEFYLGQEILKDTAGEYRPIIWSEYRKNTGKYQGSFDKNDKQVLQNNFRSRIKKIRNGESAIVENDEEWNSLREIVHSIEKAAYELPPL